MAIDSERPASSPPRSAASSWPSSSPVLTPPSVTDSEQAVALVLAAHGVCPYSNATRGNIDVHLTANGAEVEHG